VLSDRGVDADHAPIPSLLAVSAVHLYLIQKRKRMQIDIVVESAEPREVMHFALLFGFGANAVNPYMILPLSTKKSNRAISTWISKQPKDIISKLLIKVY